LASQHVDEPCFFGRLCRRFMPTQSVRDAMDVNIYTYAMIPDVRIVNQSARMMREICGQVPRNLKG
jgi:hypothetical protein